MAGYHIILSQSTLEGPEFIGTEFWDPLAHAGIMHAPTTACNPQPNSIIKAIH